MFDDESCELPLLVESTSDEMSEVGNGKNFSALMELESFLINVSYDGSGVG